MTNTRSNQQPAPPIQASFMYDMYNMYCTCMYVHVHTKQIHTYLLPDHRRGSTVVGKVCTSLPRSGLVMENWPGV